MPMPFLLDTNAYYLFFQFPKSPSYLRLTQKVKAGTKMSFYISEITSMEIHSVLGKYHRRSPRQLQQCKREIIVDGQTAKCSNTWIFPGRKRLKLKVFRDIRKMISDIETRRGDIQATMLKLNDSSIARARELLMKYADRYNHSSHDALIAASLIIARKVQGLDLTLVTSDKGLQAVLRDEAIPFYDPATT